MQAIRTVQFANLDFLRATAVILVLVDHLLLKFHHDRIWKIDTQSLGHFGVLLFFVHTSLVLMYSLARSTSQEAGSVEAVGTFYIRRAFRIFPLSMLAVLFVVALHLSSAGGRGLVPSLPPRPGEFLSNLFLVQNLTYSGSILGVLWSLPLELQMYVLLPFIFFWVKRYRRLQGSLPLLGVWLAAALVSELWIHLHVLGRLNLLIFVPNFAGGIIAFAVGCSQKHEPRIASPWWPVLILVLIFGYVLLPIVSVGWLLCLVLGLAIPMFQEMQGKWLNWVSKKIATYSYGIYLTHSFCVWIAFSALAAHSTPIKVSALVASIVVLPILLYHGVEQPLIKMGGAVANRFTEALLTYLPSRPVLPPKAARKGS